MRSQRRVIFGGIALAGILVLLLAVMGVFSSRPEEQNAGTSGTDQAPTAEIGLTGFRVEGEGWWLVADEGSVTSATTTSGAKPPAKGPAGAGSKTGPAGSGYSTHLKNPHLHVIRPAKDGEAAIDATADSGDYTPTPQRIEMTGNVHVTYAGSQKGSLTTDRLTVMPTDGIGNTDSLVNLILTSEEGEQHLSGRGAQFVMKDRTARLEHEIRMKLTGGTPIFGEQGGAAQEKPQPAVSEITCEGPCLADGFERTILFNNKVTLRQGESQLQARRMEVRFGATVRTPERFAADGDVKFKAGGVEGSCDALTRTTADEMVVLTGKPVVVQQETSHIRADRVALNLKSKAIEVPEAGDLAMTDPKSDDPAQKLTVAWKNSMRFSHAEKRAIFRGQVLFDTGSQKVTSDRLIVKFDDEVKQPIESRAEENVHVTGLMKPDADKPPVALDATSQEMTFRHVEKTLAFGGKAAVKYGNQTVRADRQIAMDLEKNTIQVDGPGSLEAVPEQAEKGEPMNIHWSGSMRFARADGKAEFWRDVELVSGARQLHSDLLTAVLGPKNELQSFEATGQASGQAKLTEESPEKKVRTLAAKIVHAKIGPDGKPEEFTAVGDATFEEKGAEANDWRRLRADRMDTRLGADNRMAGLHATGAVRVEQQEQIAEGQDLTWDVEKDTGTLSGSPAVVKQGDQKMYGDTVEFSRSPDRVRVTGSRRVEGSFRTTEKLELPKP